MRDNKVLLRGEAPPRSVWRLSHLSEVFTRRASSASVAAEEPEQPPSAVSSFFRRLSYIINAMPDSPGGADRHDAPAASLEPVEKATATPPRSPGSSPRRNSHLRQRSTGSAVPGGPRSPARTTLAQVAEDEEASMAAQ